MRMSRHARVVDLGAHDTCRVPICSLTYAVTYVTDSLDEERITAEVMVLDCVCEGMRDKRVRMARLNGYG